MDSVPVRGLDEFDRHLDDLIQDPTLELNAKLFDDIELQLTEANIPPLIPRFLPRLTTILKTYTRELTIITNITGKLIRPVSFVQVMQMASPDDLIQALESPSSPANVLALAILQKASASPQEVTMLSAYVPLVKALIHRWLSSPRVEVGQGANKVLGDLLDVDCPLPPPPPPPPTAPGENSPPIISRRKAPGNGSLWKLLFQDKEIYTYILELCSGRHPETAHPRQLSLAQGRLLRLLPRLAALDFRAVSHSHITPPTPVHLTNGNQQNGDSMTPVPPVRNPRPGDGLLQFAALCMVQRSDQLMHLNLIDFFEALVSLLRVTEHTPLKVEVMRSILREATAGDEMLKKALLSLPDRTVDEEAEDLKKWIEEIMPGETVRLAIR